MQRTGRKATVRAASQTSTTPGEMNLRITSSHTKASMEKKIETRKSGYFSIFRVCPAGMTQMLIAVMTRMLKAPEPMIKFDPSSSF